MAESTYPSWLTLVIIVILLINFSLFFFALRFIHSIWVIKDEQYLQARKIGATLYCSIPLMFIMILHPMLLCLYFWIQSNNDIMHTIIHILVIILAVVPLVCVAFRLWLFYYKCKLSEAYFKEKRLVFQRTKKEELKSNTPAGQRQSVSPFVSTPKHDTTHEHCASTTDSVDKSYPDVDPVAFSSDEIIKMESTIVNPLQFWINHKQFGSYRWCLYTVFIFFLIDICTIAICSFVDVLISYVIQAVIYLVLLIFIHYHVKQLSPVFKEDLFFLRTQFVSELKMIYFNFVLWIICLLMWLSTLYIYDTVYIRIATRFLLHGNMALTSFLFIVVQFAIPFHRFEANKEQLSSRNVLNAHKKDLKTKRMLKCIGDREGYYLFMEHLMKEFCVENLLFITEVMFMKEKFEDSLLVGNTLRKWSERGSSASSESNEPKPKPFTNNKISKLAQIPEAGDTVNEIKGKDHDVMVEMAVINGKRLTIDTHIKEEKKTDNTISKMFDEHSAQIKSGNMRIPKLPHTITMAESMKQNNLFDTVDMIYDNYIVQSAAYAVNISYGQRTQITKIILQHRASLEHQRKKLEAKGITVVKGDVVPSGLSGIIVDVHIFDEAYWEIIQMLKTPWMRFIATEEYKLYCASMDK